MNVSRRTIFKFTLAGAALMSGPWPQLPEAAEELKMPGNVPEEKFDFETKGVQGWSTVTGRGPLGELAGDRGGRRDPFRGPRRTGLTASLARPGHSPTSAFPRRSSPLWGPQVARAGMDFR